MKLNNKIAVITGAGSGIGEAIAKRFAEEGATVVLFGRTMEALQRVAYLISTETLCVQGDIANVGDLERLYSTVKNKYGRVDTIVANAGVARLLPLKDVDEETYDYITNINLKGTYFTVQKAADLLSENGTVVLVSSGLDIKAAPGYSVYSATKAGVRSLARSFSLELAEKSVRVNVLSPGPITTPIMEKQGVSKEAMEDAFEQFKSVIPSNRIGEPEEMASAALFLASDESSYVNATALYADGGYSQV